LTILQHVSTSAPYTITQMSYALWVHCVSIWYNIVFFHVHAHVGHPWNELADSICTHVKKYPPNVFNIPYGPISTNEVRRLDLAVSLSHSFIESRLMHHSSDAMRLALDASVIAGRIDNFHTGTDSTLSHDNPHAISFVQYRVNSLKPAHIRTSLVALFKRNRVAIMSLRETRARKDSLTVESGIIICSSKSSKGQYGCETWVNPAVPFIAVDGVDVVVDLNSVTVLQIHP